ncbi:MAG: DUF4139 domain-containing protein [Paracoccus sp. (in: a-proteobacteria)]|nr:DUF4139 domain-containing protein [Paracoccus sp. (in: a-proteobacteria)]
MRAVALMLVTCAPGALLADIIEASAPVSEATLYPWGASVTREVAITPAPGQHELVIPGLPDIDPASLRVQTDGVRIGSVAVQTQRPQPAAELETPKHKAAEEAVKAARKALRDYDNRMAQVRLGAEAAKEKLEFLRELAANASPPDDIAGWLDQIGQQISAALSQAHAAEAEAQNMQEGRDELKNAYEKALAALEAIGAPPEPGRVLVMALESDGAPATIRFTSFIADASWSPVYDLRLNTVAAPALALERGLMVQQGSGEDWHDVTLTLSTARPSDQSSASTVSPWFRRISDPAVPMPMARAKSEDVAMAAPAPAAPIAEAAAVEMMGATVTYRYPTPVDLRSGADALRLRLDVLALTPEIVAEAAPSLDTTAFLSARAGNDSGQVLLPGPATLYADGAMVGQQELPLTAAGDELALGFGPIDGIPLERRIIAQSEGGRGLISKENAQDETIQIIVRNLTGQDWPLRLTDRVPVSTQDDLRITWQASPTPTEENPDGQRGVLRWDSTLAAGETKEFSLTTELRWPKDKELQ